MFNIKKRNVRLDQRNVIFNFYNLHFDYSSKFDEEMYEKMEDGRAGGKQWENKKEKIAEYRGLIENIWEEQ